MPNMSPTFEALVEKFRSLPGIGAKTATRLAFYILGISKEDAFSFSQAIINVKERLGYCKKCLNISEGELCGVCMESRRESAMVCVVENPRDIVTFERVKEYSGTYHVLHGLISPIDGIGPEQLHVKELLARISDDGVREIIIATNPTLEGEATAMYLSRLIKPLGVTVSRLAYGIPVGSEIEYADEATLWRAFEGRRLI